MEYLCYTEKVVLEKFTKDLIKKDKFKNILSLISDFKISDIKSKEKEESLVKKWCSLYISERKEDNKSILHVTWVLFFVPN